MSPDMPADMTVSRTDSGAIRILTIERPDALNAINPDVIRAVAREALALREAADSGIRVAILRGSGERAFAAGADVKAMLEMDATQGARFAREGQEAMLALTQAPIPVIAAVHGFCLGGGFELALSCDMIWAAENAVFGFPEVTLGLLPGFAGTQKIVRSVGANRAKDLVLSGRKILAPEALAMGAIARVLAADTFWDTVQNEASKLACNGPLGMQLAKDLVRMAQDVDADNGSRSEAYAFGVALGHHQAKEGIRALLEKRKPDFHV